MIFIWGIVFIGSLFVLVKSADYLTKYAEQFGILIGISPFVVGAVIIAIGTSLPELVSSLFALNLGITTYAIDNVVGATIVNTLLNIGIATLLVRGLRTTHMGLGKDFAIFFGVVLIFIYFILDQTIVNWEGIILVGLYIIFFFYSLFSKHQNTFNIEDKEKLAVPPRAEKGVVILRAIGIIALSGIFLALGARVLVSSVLEISTLLGITSSIIVIVAVSIGTSLPEMFTSIFAVLRGNHGMAIGNVLGSNTFNLLLIGGLPALFADLHVSPTTWSIGLPFLLLGVLASLLAIRDEKIRPWEGVIMIIIYIFFLVKMFGIL